MGEEYLVKDRVEDPHSSEEIELYGDPGIATFNAKVPLFLMFIYMLLPIWGFFVWYYFWNGSVGWLDRGYWQELQIVANTTYPHENSRFEPGAQMNDELQSLKKQQVINDE